MLGGMTSPGTVDARVVKALGHPLRQRILHVLSEGVASPNQIAQKLDEPLGNVSYHVRILLENGGVELVDTRPVRGAVEHFYRATMRAFLDDRQWARLPAATRRAVFGQMLQQLGEHVADAAQSHGFERLETHISWTPLQLDEQGWQEMARLLAGVLEDVAEIEAESLARMEEAGDAAEPVRSEVAMLHFERAPRKPEGSEIG
jgi:DNA-binding transcriptional ArsR family regulator